MARESVQKAGKYDAEIVDRRDVLRAHRNLRVHDVTFAFLMVRLPRTLSFCGLRASKNKHRRSHRSRFSPVYSNNLLSIKLLSSLA